MGNFVTGFMLLWVLCAAAQSGTPLPGYSSQLSKLNYGDSIKTVITNTDNKPISIYFFSTTPARENFSNTDSFITWLRVGLKDSSEHAAWLAMVQRLGSLLKSHRFNNYPQPYSIENAPNQLSAKKYSISGFMLSQHAAKCGEYAAFACNTLIKAGVSPKALRIAYVRNGNAQHTLFEINIGRWVAVDVDRMPFFMFPNPQGGYYSIKELIKDTSRIIQRYTCGSESRDLCPMNLTAQYRNIFTHPKVRYYKPQPIKTEEYGAQTILCQGCSLTYQYAYSGVSINSGDKAGCLLIDSLQQVIGRGSIDTQQLAGVFKLAAEQNGISISQSMHAMLAESKINCFNKSWNPLYTDTVPTLAYVIPPSADTLYIGRQVRAPLLLAAIQGIDAQIEIGDTFFIGSVKLDLWKPNDDKPPLVSNNQVQYLAGQGKIYPHNHPITLLLYVNPWNYMDFWNGGRLQSNSLSPINIKQLYNGLPLAPNAGNKPGNGM